MKTEFVKLTKRGFAVQVTKATDSTNLVTPPKSQSHATKNLATYDDLASRNFTYFMVGTYSFVGAVVAKNIITDYLEHFSASADVLALAKVEVDMASVPAGKNIIIKWRGKPIFVRHRTLDGNYIQ
jgi:ubiquinol-cytochrome c reductase iron-sulfur subunit